jgi:hypothetical protein
MQPKHGAAVPVWEARTKTAIARTSTAVSGVFRANPWAETRAQHGREEPNQANKPPDLGPGRT